MIKKSQLLPNRKRLLHKTHNIVQKRVDEITRLVIPLTVFTGNLESGAHPVGLGRKSQHVPSLESFRSSLLLLTSQRGI